MIRVSFALLASLVVPLCAAAQQDAPAGTSVAPAFGIHYGNPLRLSGAIGFLVDRNRLRDDGLIVLLEGGQHGGELAMGYFRSLGRFGSGYSIRAVALRTTGEPWNASPHTTYAGVEAHAMLFFGLGGRMGYYRRASAATPDAKDNVETVGISIGY
ncbi:MAG: hypothetical protein H0W68_05105 [Gemmatimonadaceae bacterium]|nr:hypothetical protein [Gemmatimonadaceae bacterium]